MASGLRHSALIWAVLFSLPLLSKEKGILPTAYGVEENYLLLQSIDATVSNYGEEEDKLIYKRAVQHYLEFQSLFYKRRYDQAEFSAKRMQRVLVPLYDRLIQRELKKIGTELQLLTVAARGNEKPQTKAFIRLTYRNLKESESKRLTAANSRPYLNLLKLRDYLFSLKIQKQAGKYMVLLGLLHLNDNYPRIETTEFFTIEKMVTLHIPKDKMPEYRLRHWDNALETYEKENCLSLYIKEPNMEDLAKPLLDIDPPYTGQD